MLLDHACAIFDAVLVARASGLNSGYPAHKSSFQTTYRSEQLRRIRLGVITGKHDPTKFTRSPANYIASSLVVWSSYASGKALW